VADDAILTYLDDDGTIVEPIFYAPIIPMLLVNGSKGIGTGFSTDVMCYNPNEIVNYLKAKLRNEDYTQEFVPFYDGFTGTIEKIGDSKFMIRGKYETLATDKIRVTELPVGYWTDNFKEHLESLIESDQIKDYQDMSRDTNVDFTIVFSKGKLAELELVKLDHGCNGVDKLLKLTTTHTTTNMHAFDAKDKLRKFEKVEEIIDLYFETRLDLYNERKKHLIISLQGELKLLSNKAKYIQANLDGTIDLRKKTKEQVLQLLSGFDKMNDDDDYKYLTKMTMDSVTEENVTRLFNEHKQKSDELDIIQKRTIQEMWLSELEDLQKELNRKKIIIKKVIETKNKIKK
jgi:DNA topoisomerase-2